MIAAPLISSAVWLVLIAAALQDLWRLRISNILPVLLILLFPLSRAPSCCTSPPCPLWVWRVGFETDLWQNAALFAFALSVGLLLFARRWLGGGDVKLFAAVALWFDFHGAPYLLLAITIGGGLLGLLFIMVRRVLPLTMLERSNWACLKPKGPIPYGIAIAAGTILCSHLYGFNPAPPRDIGTILAAPIKAN